MKLPINIHFPPLTSFHIQIIITLSLFTLCLIKIFSNSNTNLELTWEKTTIAGIFGYWCPSPLKK